MADPHLGVHPPDASPVGRRGTRSPLGGAALRWHDRYTREVRGVDTDEARAVLALLVLLAGARREQAARALAELCDRRELQPCGEVLLKTADVGP